MEEKKALTIRRIKDYENPYLRHFIREHSLNDSEALVLGVLLELTNQMTTAIKTTYTIISEMVAISSIPVYDRVWDLHRYRIIDAKPDGKFVQIAFNAVEQDIEELVLANKNAVKIARLEKHIQELLKKKPVEEDQLFDLIYPQLGDLITKKIASAMRSMVLYINEKLNRTLSLQMWLYRIKSLFSGIPLAELMLRDMLPYLVDEIFLIHRETGLLIAHKSRHEDELVDKDMVAGMLTAINDFVRTTFSAAVEGSKSTQKGNKTGKLKKEPKKGQNQQDIDEIVYGEYVIKILPAKQFFCAVVINGVADMQFQQQIDALVAQIHQSYHRKLVGFDGDMQKVQGIDEPLTEFIAQKSNLPAIKEKHDPLRKVKIFGILLALATTGLLAWLSYCYIADARLEKQIIIHIKKSVPAHLVNVDVDVNFAQVTLRGYAANDGALELLNEQLLKILHENQIENEVLRVDFSQISQYRQTIAQLESQIMLLQLSYIRSELEKIIIRFPINVYNIGNQERFQVKRAAEIIKPYDGLNIEIIAFSDNIGSFEVNKRLAEARMLSIKNELIEQGLSEKRIAIHEYDPELLANDPRLEKFKEERGIILFAYLPQDRLK